MLSNDDSWYVLISHVLTLWTRIIRLLKDTYFLAPHIQHQTKVICFHMESRYVPSHVKNHGKMFSIAVTKPGLLSLNLAFPWASSNIFGQFLLVWESSHHWKRGGRGLIQKPWGIVCGTCIDNVVSVTPCSLFLSVRLDILRDEFMDCFSQLD